MGRLSGGERNRLHLARIIKRACNVLLLDEPTNDLGNPSFSIVVHILY